MELFIDIIFYILVFLAIYVQVFFILTFIEKRHFLKEKTPKLTKFPEVTFLVPCWNEEDTIEPTIEGIKALDYPEDKIFIVAIDDGSSDKTWNVLQQYKYDPQIKILKKENGGKHSALNMGLKHVQTDFVCSFDADTFIMPDALSKAVAQFQEDKNLDALGGAVLVNKPKTIVQAAQSIDYQMFSFSKKILGLLGGVLVVPGAFSMFKKETLQKVGGYKDGHLLEDLELTYRLQVNGFKVDHCHNAFVYTKGPESLKALFKQRLRWSYGMINNTYDYRKAILNKKYGNFGLFTLPMSIIFYFVVLFIFFLSWYNIIKFFTRKFVEVQIQGFEGLIPATPDFFFVDTKASMILTILMFATIFLSIYLGKIVSNIKFNSFKNIFWFWLVYSILVPLWVVNSIFNTVFKRKVSWR